MRPISEPAETRVLWSTKPQSGRCPSRMALSGCLSKKRRISGCGGGGWVARGLHQGDRTLTATHKRVGMNPPVESGTRVQGV